MFRTPLAAAITAAALALTTPAHAVLLGAGTTLDFNDYDLYAVTPGDVDWFGTELATATPRATEVRDGFLDGIGVVTGLYNVTAGFDITVTRSTSGRLVFEILPFARDDSFAGLFNGAKDFSISGFAGFDVDFAWTGVPLSSVLAPVIKRSADGDTLTFDMLDPRTAVPGVYENLLFAVDAPSFALTGSGTADILIETFGSTTRSFTGLPAPSTAVIPLPASGLALGLGLVALGAMRRRARG